VDIISISWGMMKDVPSIGDALSDAKKQGVVVLASAGNEGANRNIAFPARLQDVFCIGSADDKGNPSEFSPPFVRMEKYSALGEGVKGARLTIEIDQPSGKLDLYAWKDGTSTATPIAAGIACILIEYMCQFMDRGARVDTYGNLRKLFLRMSGATEETAYRYLAPLYFFERDEDPKILVQTALSEHAGMCTLNHKAYWVCSTISTMGLVW
jgi:Subtilase family